HTGLVSPSDAEPSSDLERSWNAFGHALAAEVSDEHGSELLDHDSGGADQLAQCPGRQLAMVGDRERGDGARLRENYVAAGLAAEDPPQPLEARRASRPLTTGSSRNGDVHLDRPDGER